MMRAISTAVTGMQAQEGKLSQISDNLANMGTTGFKRGETEFQSLMYQTIKEAGGQAGGNQNPVGVQVGTGAKVVAQYSIHEQGPTKITNRNLDVLISGDGFFEIAQKDGTPAYTRDGSFKMDSSGNLVTSGGLLVNPNIQIPQGTQGITIAANGEVRAINDKGQESTIGQLKLTSFLNPAGLKNIGSNLMMATSASGPPVSGNPSESGFGALQQGAIEASNVKPTEAIMDMITAQRIYESNARIMSVGDQMWSTTNNIGNR